MQQARRMHPCDDDQVCAARTREARQRTRRRRGRSRRDHRRELACARPCWRPCSATQRGSGLAPRSTCRRPSACSRRRTWPCSRAACTTSPESHPEPASRGPPSTSPGCAAWWRSASCRTACRHESAGPAGSRRPTQRAAPLASRSSPSCGRSSRPSRARTRAPASRAERCCDKHVQALAAAGAVHGVDHARLRAPGRQRPPRRRATCQASRQSTVEDPAAVRPQVPAPIRVLESRLVATIRRAAMSESPCPGGTATSPSGSSGRRWPLRRRGRRNVT